MKAKMVVNYEIEVEVPDKYVGNFIGYTMLNNKEELEKELRTSYSVPDEAVISIVSMKNQRFL